MTTRELPEVPGRRLREDTILALALQYGIPANPLTFAEGPAAAARVAVGVGQPVAIKLVADGVVHKSACGGVLLGVDPADAEGVVEGLFARQRASGVEPRGVTVEPMAAPGLEVVAGALHDPGFGPVVMVGAGGVDVEALDDVAFGLVPLDREAALRLIDRTRVGGILRRRFPTQHGLLAEVVVALGGHEGMLLRERVDQIDLNPIVVNTQGLLAVDARAVTRAEGEITPHARPADPDTVYQQLRPAIYPTSVAVVGASANPEKMGHRVVRTAVEQGFDGALYPVSRSCQSVAGVPTVPAVGDMPLDVECAVVAVPAAAVPQALADLAARGVQTAHVLTADTCDLEPVASDTGMRILGPNCIGHDSPYVGLSMVACEASSTERGNIAFISQSGTYAGDMVRRGNEVGLRFSFVSSVGNCHDVSVSELLAFCEADPATHVAAFYLEDDSDAGDFFRLACEMTTPVVLFKGGRSAVGSVAAVSHTGALASDPRLLADVAQEAGVVMVEGIEALMDVLLLVQHNAGFTGRGLGLLGTGGGVAVVGADVAGRSGLVVPEWSQTTQRALSVYQAPGSSVRNPIDIPTWSIANDEGSVMGELVEAVAADPGIDRVCAYTDMGTVYDVRSGVEAERMLAGMTWDVVTAERGAVPVVWVLRSSYSAEQEALVRRLRREAAAQGVVVMESVERAVAALGRMRHLTTRHR